MSLYGVFIVCVFSFIYVTKGTTTVDSLSAFVKIHYEIVQSYKPSAYSCRRLKAGWGSCSFIKLHLNYKGRYPVTDTKWSIYFHNIRRILASQSSLFTVTHVNGDFHRLTPTRNFGGFYPGIKIIVPMIMEYSTQSYSDVFPNMFIATEKQAKVFNSTVESSTLGSFAFGIRSSDSRQFPFSNARVRYFHNREKKLKTLQRDEIKTVIVPTPKHVKAHSETISLSHEIKISGELWYDFSQDTKDALKERFSEFGVILCDERNIFHGHVYEIVLSKPTETLSVDDVDSYEMDIRENETMISGHMTGVFYGLQSFMSLLEIGNLELPAMEVADSGRFRHRGLMVDVGRNCKSKRAILQLLDQMAYYKLNVFHFHLSDDEGWRLEIPGLPELTEYGARRCWNESMCLLPQLGSGPDSNNQGSGYYSVHDYVEIVRYANARFIKVIPEFDMPGHARAAVKAMEMRYLKYANLNQSKAEEYRLLDPDDTTNMLSIQSYDRTTSINPCMLSSYRFVDKLVTEVQKMHSYAGQPLNDWHFGGDEVTNVLLGGGFNFYRFEVPPTIPWKNSKICKEAKVDIKKIKLAYTKKVSSILKSKGIKQMHVWSDAIEDHVNEADFQGNITATLWKPLQDGAIKDFQKLAKAGFQTVLAVPNFLYFDMPYEVNPYERGYYWATRSVDLWNVFSFAPTCLPQNIEYSKLPSNIGSQTYTKWPSYNGMPIRIKGIQGQVWSETIRSDAQMDYMTFPRLIALAERAWHKAGWENDESSCAGKTFGLDTRGQPIHSYRGDINAAYNIFANVLGQRELLKLDKSKVKYRLPPVGCVVSNGILHANVDIPGIKTQYSTDGRTWINYEEGKKHYVGTKKVFMRSVNPDGSRFRLNRLDDFCRSY